MKSVRLFRVAGGQSVLVLELPRRRGLSEARVVVRAAAQSQVHKLHFNESAACAYFVQSFNQRSAGYAVASLLSQGGGASVQ
jgi:hypothetical protein